MTNQPKKLVCPECGGMNLIVQPLAWWDTKRQDWDFEFVDGYKAYCGDCDDFVDGEFAPIDPTQETDSD